MIGLIGGSFDPPHAGHMNLATWALKILPLNNIWWVVSKQNPLKNNKPNDFKIRLNQTKRLVQGSNMLVKDYEQKFNINYTVELLSHLKTEYPYIKFVWLMGADTMFNFHKWKKWEKIFQMVPIIVFARPGYNDFWDSTVACEYKESFINSNEIDLVNNYHTPIWTFLDIPMKNVSSTNIRSKMNNNS